MIGKNERNNFLICTGVQEIITRWTEDTKILTPEELKYLRAGRSYIRKALKKIIESLAVEDVESAEQLMRDAKKQSLMMTPKRSVLKSWSTVDSESFNLLSQMVVNDCQERPEEWCLDNHKDCILKQALMGCGVEYRNKSKGCKTCRYREKE